MLDLRVMATAPLCLSSNKMKINGKVKLQSCSSLFGSEKPKLFVGRKQYSSSSSLKASVPANYEASELANVITRDPKADEALQGDVFPARIIIDPPSPPVKGVNLGGWLLVEGWMTPWLFENMPNCDLLDGNRVRFRSVAANKYLVAKDGGGAAIIAEESIPTGSDDSNTFALWRITESVYQFRVTMKTKYPGIFGVVPTSPFVGPDNQEHGGLVAVTTTPGETEEFEIIRNPDDKNFIRIKACSTELFIQVKQDGSVAADYSEKQTSWGVTDPSVFRLEAVGQPFTGEYQLINGWGKDKAAPMLLEHWESYITEDDFQFMASNGVNAVRIPVGFWIAYFGPLDPIHPVIGPDPFLPGSKKFLDRAFDWGEKYGIRIIIDLHAVPGAANPATHGGSRDGCIYWGYKDKDEESELPATVVMSVEIIRILAQSYKNRSNLLAIEVINEPVYPSVHLDTLKEYYQLAYRAIREICPSCYVIFSNRFMTDDETELLEFASEQEFYRVVLDMHNYQQLWPTANEGAQENINYVIHDCYQTMAKLNPPNGRPLLYIGEWTGQWTVQGASNEKFKEFTLAQQQVYTKASFGWTFWSFKNTKGNEHWSFKWMVEHGYLRIN